MARWEQVRRYALALPGAIEETSYGDAAWKVNKKLFVWERPLPKSDIAALGDAAPTGAILGVRTADLAMKEALLASDPAHCSRFRISTATPRCSCNSTRSPPRP
jgi:hypothetical protein